MNGEVESRREFRRPSPRKPPSLEPMLPLDEETVDCSAFEDKNGMDKSGIAEEGESAGTRGDCYGLEPNNEISFNLGSAQKSTSLANSLRKSLSKMESPDSESPGADVSDGQTEGGRQA